MRNRNSAFFLDNFTRLDLIINICAICLEYNHGINMALVKIFIVELETNQNCKCASETVQKEEIGHYRYSNLFYF